MAALALPASRRFAQAFKAPFARPLLAATASLPTLFAAPNVSGWRLPAAVQSLLELFPSFDLAVPKKKTSHSRKAMRSANKGLKDKHNLVHCQGCGAPKLAHHLCPNCYSSLSRGWKAMARQVGKALGADSPSP